MNRLRWAVPASISRHQEAPATCDSVPDVDRKVKQEPNLAGNTKQISMGLNQPELASEEPDIAARYFCRLLDTGKPAVNEAQLPWSNLPSQP